MTATIEIFKYEKNVAEFAAGAAVFSLGDAGDLMYVIQSGEVEVSVNGRVIDTLGPGGVFGEMALIDHAPRTATVTAKTDCRLVPIDEPRFLNHVHRTPFFALQVMRIMNERLRRRMSDAG
ncbi:putative transcriptional regulator, Crp/Fnr family [Candidatus Promineifilum breve]|uniref:Transcriptional regulator, Crp/Fnr family n=1 Tax=Candidatus Promineifilum breve TaxID=1806508 RepID=A0A160T5L7_9CHLR|nr:cyclic nucleotide-binding domain-containing protein [Candidatus Promineifilum breve]CUS05556.1 putative transcriptional regulator, Crp/Fnr family [Candidatus Promineifilum breve]